MVQECKLKSEGSGLNVQGSRSKEQSARLKISYVTLFSVAPFHYQCQGSRLELRGSGSKAWFKNAR